MKTTVRVGANKGTITETLFTIIGPLDYMPCVGDSLTCFSDRVGTIKERLFSFDEQGNVTITFVVDISKTLEENLAKWAEAAYSKE